MTANPTAEWIARQLTEACGWEAAPDYIVRDRDCAYGEAFIRRLRAMGICDRPTAPRSPWQSIRRARHRIDPPRLLDQTIIFGERHSAGFSRPMSNTAINPGHTSRLPRIAQWNARHKDPAAGEIIAISQVGGLHHRYQRIAA